MSVPRYGVHVQTRVSLRAPPMSEADELHTPDDVLPPCPRPSCAATTRHDSHMHMIGGGGLIQRLIVIPGFDCCIQDADVMVRRGLCVTIFS